MVHFVGAGPGAVDLITVRGARWIQEADVIIYAGSLVNPALLAEAKEDCRIYDSARMTLEDIIAVMQEANQKGETVVRLHTGEPSLYGAVREQMDALDELGISYDSTPGVTAAFGAAASLNLEYTIPEVSQTLIVTRMEGRTPVPKRESIAKLAAHQTSMAIYLSAGQAEQLREELLKGGYREDTPVAVVYKATWDEEKIIYSTLNKFSAEMAENKITKHAVILVGDAIGYSAGWSEWYHRIEQKENERDENEQTDKKRELNGTRTMDEVTSTNAEEVTFVKAGTYSLRRSRLYNPNFSTGYRQAKSSTEGDKDKIYEIVVDDKPDEFERKLSINIISFTSNGDAVARKTAEQLEKENVNITLFPIAERRKSPSEEDLRENRWNNLTNDGEIVEKDETKKGVIDDAKRVSLSVRDIVKSSFDNQIPILFIGAMGICVRLIAPYMKDKLQDIPVLVMDEKGEYIIPVLSGHIGGANHLAEYLAKRMNSTAILTTATDVQGVFAVDVWATEQGLSIVNKDGIQKVSSKLLAGETVKLTVQDDRFEIGESGLPAGIEVVSWVEYCKEDEEDAEGGEYFEIRENSEKSDNSISNARIGKSPTKTYGGADICIMQMDECYYAIKEKYDRDAKEQPVCNGRQKHPLLYIAPKRFVIGVGCKRGISEEQLETFIKQIVKNAGINWNEIAAIATVDRKAKEEGLITFCQKNRLPLMTYSAEQLAEVQGDFAESPFVRETVGVDNVCERAAAVYASKQSDEWKKVVEKTAKDGMTVAIYEFGWKIVFSWEV